MNQNILVRKYLPKSNDCLVIPIMGAPTLLLVQGDQALPRSLIVGIDSGCSKISVLCVIVLIQSIAGETKEDIPTEKNKPN
jgi:hypothetical protein